MDQTDKIMENHSSVDLVRTSLLQPMTVPFMPLKCAQPGVQQMAVGVWWFRATYDRGTDSDVLIDMYMTCSQPHSRPLSGRRQSQLPLKWSIRKNAPFLPGLLRGQQSSRRLSFSSLWVGGCRLRFVTQWTCSRRSGVWWSVSSDPDKRGRHAAVGPKGPVVTHS